MRRIIVCIFICLALALPVSAMEFTAPTAPDAVEEYMPPSSSSFLHDLWYIVRKAVSEIAPSFTEAIRCCVSVVALAVLISLLRGTSNISAQTVNLAGTIAISVVLLSPSNSLIKIGIATVNSLSEYGKLLLPIITAALAAEGGATTSTALYTGTVIFNTVLLNGITNLLIPILYAYIALGIANSAIDEPILKNLHEFSKWLITWSIKIAIYVFTGYLGISGVVSGTVDATAIKAAKLAISGSVPVIGSIISDASETILVSAGIMKNSTGIYGLLVIMAIWIKPFLQIGIQYLVLKITAAVSAIFASKRTVSLIENFSGAMGFLVAITSAVCLLHLVSIVCFMKGVA